MPLNRDQMIAAFQRKFPNISISKSEDGGWNAGYITVLDDSGNEDGSDSVYQSEDNEEIKPQILKFIASNGWKLHTYDDELFFLALATDGAPKFES